MLAGRGLWSDEVRLGGELAKLVLLWAVVAEVEPDPRSVGEGTGWLVSLRIVKGRPPVVHDCPKCCPSAFAGVVEGSDSGGDVVLTGFACAGADSPFRAQFEQCCSSGAFASEAVQAEGEPAAPVQVVEGRVRYGEDGPDFNGSQHGPILSSCGRALQAASVAGSLSRDMSYSFGRLLSESGLNAVTSGITLGAGGR